ncbi:homeobox protein 2 isoform X2 [Condylostylus longicornis]|uniref:homeobox protein 2 isoform X2 n=1 Tax=Condylostylus longicornis TaxID=2530218 RepID=UPI00244DAD6E|nr:homeobox protein 2 isoform X2 [Condylostylus longicornis]
MSSEPNKNNPQDNNSINNKNSEINNKVNRKKPIPPPRRFLPHMAPTLPPTPPLKPRNLSKATIVELQQATTTTVINPTNSIKVSPPIVSSRSKSTANKNLSSSLLSTSPHDMRSQLKDDDDIYQPIWKCQTLNTVEKNNNNSKSDFESKYVGNNKASSFSNNNESDINNKDFIEGADIKDDSSTTEDSSEKITINTTEDDHSQWETDDEFMFSTKMNIKESNSINYPRNSNTNSNDLLIKTNKENDDDDFNCGSSLSTSTGSTLTGSNCIRISKSDPELKMESFLINNANSYNVKNDQKTTMINFDNTNQNNFNSWKTVCILYSPSVAKYRKILYDYNSNEINFKLNDNFLNINDNIKLNTSITNNNNNNSNNNSFENNNETQLESRITTKPLPQSLNLDITNNNYNNKNDNNNTVILRSDSFRMKTSLHRNYENIALKRKITAMAAIASSQNSSNTNCNNNITSESTPLTTLTNATIVADESEKYGFLYKQNFNNNFQSIILAWKETLMNINLIEDEEDMFVSEEEILKLKETAVQSDQNNFQKFKSQSTDNLHNIPDAQDKKSIRERFRNKLQRGVLKLNSRQVKDSGNKKGKESFKRLNVNSVCFEDQPKYPIFDAELQEVEMNGICENVPRFVVDCIEIIEQKDCIQIDGLYRASGNKVAIDDLKKRLTENYIFDYKMLMKNEDIHTITGLLKLFFRELKTPLIPESYYRKLPDNLVDNSNLPLIKEILNEIPQPSLGTLKYLLKHLTTVAQYSSENRMPASNLAIVWGPCILLSENTGPFDIGRMNTLAKVLIEKYDFIFGDDERLVN